MIWNRKVRLFGRISVNIWVLLAIILLGVWSLSGDEQTIEDPDLLIDANNLPLSGRKIETKKDYPFSKGCVADMDTSGPRENAAMVVLTRNSELEGVVKSMKSLESHFNKWFNYPWIFLNEEPFEAIFKETVIKHTSSVVEFGVISSTDWEFDSKLDPKIVSEQIESQGDRTILYGNLASYHKMCRYFSGFFYKHELVKKLDWYWRVEPDVEFFCDLTYDPFVAMQKSGKKYGFTVMIPELYWTVPNLFRYTKAFIRENGIKLPDTWSLFLDQMHQVVGKSKHKYNIDYMRKEDDEIMREIEKQKKIDQILAKDNLKSRDLNYLDQDLLKKIMADSKKKPRLREEDMDGEEYNLCHFWSNFEIARVDLWSSPEYESYFQYLENSGGFISERWGDAPVHSLGVGMFLNLSEIHYFRDIGYEHSKIAHCPKNYDGGVAENKSDKLYSGVGCNCKCPKDYIDIENMDICLARWEQITKDDFTPRVIDVDMLEKKVEGYLNTGGSLNNE